MSCVQHLGSANDVSLCRACPSSSRLHIVVKRKQFLLFTSKYARIEVPAGADDTTAQSITGTFASPL